MHKVLIFTVLTALSTVFCGFVPPVFAQQSAAPQFDREDILGMSETDVVHKYGEPVSKSNTVGTHADYCLWKYSNFTVAFANRRAIHIFDAKSLHRTVELND